MTSPLDDAQPTPGRHADGRDPQEQPLAEQHTGGQSASQEPHGGEAREADVPAAMGTAPGDDDPVAGQPESESGGVPVAAAGPADEVGAVTPAPASRKGELEREGEIAADFLETLLDIADLDGDLDVDIDGDRAAVSIVDSEEGTAPGRLVGPDGTVLEALQELTRLAVQAETGERSRLMLDVAGYRAERKIDLIETARGVIKDVTEQGERRELAPMSAFERKVVHDEVLRAGLRSESQGEEPQRYVVVLPER